MKLIKVINSKNLTTMTKNKNKPGDRVKELREFYSLTQQQMAEHLGFKTAQSVSKIERGEVTLTLSLLRTLEGKFNVNPDFITNGGAADATMLKDGKKAELVSVSEQKNPWQDELYKDLRNQVDYLKRMLELALGSKDAMGKLVDLENAAHLSMVA